LGRNTKLSALADVNDHILDLEFQLRNTTGEDITITLHHPYQEKHDKVMKLESI